MLPDLLKIGAAYIRVSDERQDEYSPDSQLKKIREYAEKEGYQIPDEYVFYDDGISGRNVKKRDDFNRMITTAREKSRPFETIFVWRFSRFARNQEQAILYKNLLRKSGVSVVSVSEPIPEGHFGSLIERILEWEDEWYSIRLGEEVQRGMTEKVSRGEPVVAPPFGYVMKDGMYYPDESGKADVVREVFERYAAGERQRALAVSIGDKGFRTKYGNRPDSRFVDYMLCNSTYIGKIRWTADGSRAISSRKLNEGTIMEVDGKHEPLISKELWDKVQALRNAQKKQYPKHSRREQPVEYMVKGLVRCSNCGATLVLNNTTSGKTKTVGLQCHNYNRGQCKTSHYSTIGKIEAALVEGLEKALKSRRFTMAPQKPKKQDNGGIDYDKLIALEERRLQRAKDAYLAEIDTIEQYKANKDEITARIEELKKKREENNTPEIDINDYTQKVTDVLEFIKRDDVTAKAKNEALRTIIEHMVFEKAKGNLAIYFHAI